MLYPPVLQLPRWRRCFAWVYSLLYGLVYSLILFVLTPRQKTSQQSDRHAAAQGDRQAVRILLLGDPDAVDQCVIELERRGFCDSYAWTPPIAIRASAPPIQPRSGELMRVFKRWYPATGQRIPF